MKIYLAGGIHQDPLCRPALVNHLTNLIGFLGGPPSLVAVEMDAGIKWDLKLRRASLYRLFGGLWDEGVEGNVRQPLAETLAWEVDSHRSVLPDVDPIFLDEGHSRSDATSAALFFSMIVQAAQGFQGDRKSPQQVKQWISSNLCAAADETWQKAYDDRRDEQAYRQKTWLEILKPELGKEGWGLAIVGALHASRHDPPNMFRWLLEDAGCLGGVKYLTWQPPVPIR